MLFIRLLFVDCGMLFFCLLCVVRTLPFVIVRGFLVVVVCCRLLVFVVRWRCAWSLPVVVCWLLFDVD